MLDVVVEKSRGEFQLDLDLQVSTGVLALFGPSGAGKSLTLKLVAGIETPDAGRISIDGVPIFDAASGINLKPQERRVGYVPQNFGIFPHLSTIENIAFPLLKRSRKLSKKQAYERSRKLLDTFGLADREDARAHELSGGQLQRVAFARALASEPRILLLDEPFSAIDAPFRAELRREFKRFQREFQIPTIFITHDLEEAATVADELAILVNGQLRQIGSTRSVLDQPADQEVAKLAQARNILYGTARTERDRVIIETKIGQLEALAGLSGLSGNVVAVIRPESISVVNGDRQPSNRNIVQGTISEIIDQGMRMAVFVRVGAGDVEISLLPTEAAELHLETGSSICLTIPPDRIHLIT